MQGIKSASGRETSKILMIKIGDLEPLLAKLLAIQCLLEWGGEVLLVWMDIAGVD